MTATRRLLAALASRGVRVHLDLRSTLRVVGPATPTDLAALAARKVEVVAELGGLLPCGHRLGPGLCESPSRRCRDGENPPSHG